RGSLLTFETSSRPGTWPFRLRVGRRSGVPTRQRLRQLAERLLELARDDPELVRLALSDLRQHLQVLVREQLRVGIAGMDRLEHRLDRLRLALRRKDLRLLLPLGAQDRRLLVALRRQDLRLLDALGVENGGALVAVGAQLLLHR